MMPNYDPKLIFEQTQRYLPVEITYDDATEPSHETLLMPAADLDDLTQDGIFAAATRTARIGDLAKQLLADYRPAFMDDPDKTFQMVLRFVAGLVVANLGHVYLTRTEADPDEAARWPAEGPSPEMWEAAEQRFQVKLPTILPDTLNGNQWGSYLWHHLTFWVLLTFDRSADVPALETMADDGLRERVFAHISAFTQNDWTDTLRECMHLYGQEIARAFLEALDAAAMPLPELRQILGLESAPVPDLREVGARATSRLPPTMRQWTFQEARTLAIAIADGPALRRWAEIAGEVALRHVVPEEPLQTKFAPSALLSNWWGLPPTYDGLRSELRDMGLPALLLLHVGLGLALESTQVTVPIDTLISGIGWTPRSTTERTRMRQTIWRWLLVFDSLTVIGKRPGQYRDPKTKEIIDLRSVDALIRITGHREPVQPALDGSAPPLEVTFVAGPWLDQHRGNSQVLFYFGEIRRLAKLPAGQAAGAWAQSIGLALNQRWRERANDATVSAVGADRHLTARFRPFTRRDLLSLFRAQPDFEILLHGDKPHRAREYWEDAIQLLRTPSTRIIGHYEALVPLPPARKGWQAAWLDQPLDIRPSGEHLQAAAAIAQRATTARRGRAARKSKAK